MSRGEEIKRYRERSYLTQRRLGEMMGYHGRTAETTIQKWEYDTLSVPVKRFRRLHEIIGIPYEKLVP